MKPQRVASVFCCVVLLAHCNPFPPKGKPHAELRPGKVGSTATATAKLPPNAKLLFYEDLVDENPKPKVTVTRAGEEAPGPPPYPGKIIHMQECYRWEIDVEQGGKKSHLSCDPMGYVEHCHSTTKSGAKNVREDCRMEECKLTLPRGGPTTFTAKFDIRYECHREITEHVLRIRTPVEE